MPFKKGHTYGKGRPKGSKNKKTFDDVEWDDKTIDMVQEKIIELAKEKNVPILKKFLDVILPNAIPKQEIKKDSPFPEFEEMSEEELDKWIEANR